MLHKPSADPARFSGQGADPRAFEALTAGELLERFVHLHEEAGKKSKTMRGISPKRLMKLPKKVINGAGKK
jgi:hypothetical protein